MFVNVHSPRAMISEHTNTANGTTFILKTDVQKLCDKTLAAALLHRNRRLVKVATFTEHAVTTRLS